MKTVTAHLAGHHHLFRPGTDPTAPPLLLLHGTGGSETDLVSLAEKLSPGSALLSPRGNVDENGAARFFRRFGEGVFDVKDVRARTDALAEFIETAGDHYHLATDKMLAMGFSNGANIAACVLQRHPHRLAGGILLRAMVVLEEAPAPNSLTGKRVFLANGTLDPIIPPEHPERLARLLEQGGATVVRHTSAASHGLIRDDLEAASAFLSDSMPVA